MKNRLYYHVSPISLKTLKDVLGAYSLKSPYLNKNNIDPPLLLGLYEKNVLPWLLQPTSSTQNQLNGSHRLTRGDGESHGDTRNRTSSSSPASDQLQRYHRRHDSDYSSLSHDRSAVSNGQLWLSVFCCCGPVATSPGIRCQPDSLRDPALSLGIFRRHMKTHLFCEILTRRTQRIRDFLWVCAI